MSIGDLVNDPEASAGGGGRSYETDARRLAHACIGSGASFSVAISDIASALRAERLAGMREAREAVRRVRADYFGGGPFDESKEAELVAIDRLIEEQSK